MQNTTKKKTAPILCAIGVVIVLALYIIMLVIALRGDDAGIPLMVLIGVLYGVPVLAIIGGVLIAMRQRLREIDRGEEEEAGKY